MNIRKPLLSLAGIGVALIASLGAGCSTAPSLEPGVEPSGETTEPIVAGTNAAEPSVGILSAMVSPTERSVCSGVLVGKHTALSAAHCASTFQQTFCVFPAGDTSGAHGLPHCTQASVLPNPGYVDSDNSSDNDVAIVHLADDLTAITSSFPHGITPMMIGGPVQDNAVILLVGYGHTDPDPDNPLPTQEQAGNNRINDVEDQKFEYANSGGAWQLPGDSGGPAFPVSNINCAIGVMSHGHPETDGTSSLARVDTKVAWILSNAGDSSIRTCGQPLCGDGFCQAPEVCGTCPQDCGACPPPPPPPRCGDGICNGNESHNSCPHDCPAVTCPTGKSDCCETGACLTPRQCQLKGC